MSADPRPADLVGLWDDEVRYLGDHEGARLGLRADGSGWHEWARLGGGWEFATFAWRVSGPGELELRDVHSYTGRWEVDGTTRTGRNYADRERVTPLVTVRYMIARVQGWRPEPVVGLDLEADEHLFTGMSFGLARPWIEPGDEPTFSPPTG